MWRLAPTLVAAGLAVVYLLVKPRSPDLAAHVFRADLFGREGFTIWNGQWYGGHHTPAYSLLSPPLSWLLGPQLMGALSAVAATACFTELARNHFGARAARFGTIWFGVGSATLLATNRLPFALGTAFGMAAALALQRDRPLLAPVLAVLSAISSPVAGLFVAMAGLAYALAARGEGVPVKRRAGLALAAGGVVPPSCSRWRSRRVATRRSRSPRTSRYRCSRSPPWWSCPARSAPCAWVRSCTRWGRPWPW